MIEIRQAESDLPGDVLLGLFAHMRGLLCRRHAQHCMGLPQEPKRMGWTGAQAILQRSRLNLGDMRVSRCQRLQQRRWF
jgi:hypothetical protein